MACTFMRFGDGKSAGFFCGPRARRVQCKFCGKTSTKLCDFPIHSSKKGKTCDAPICDDHATSVGEDRDFCPHHCKQEQLQLESAARAAETLEVGR